MQDSETQISTPEFSWQIRHSSVRKSSRRLTLEEFHSMMTYFLWTTIIRHSPRPPPLLLWIKKIRFVVSWWKKKKKTPEHSKQFKVLRRLGAQTKLGLQILRQDDGNLSSKSLWSWNSTQLIQPKDLTCRVLGKWIQQEHWQETGKFPPLSNTSWWLIISSSQVIFIQKHSE